MQSFHIENLILKNKVLIEEVEDIMDGIKKFDNKHLIIPITRTISNRARKNYEGYNAFDIQQALLKSYR